MCFSKQKNNYNINYNIKFNFIRLINEENNFNRVIKLEEAIIIAKDKKLDVVQVNFDGKLPVCKILDFNKFLYKKYKSYKEEKKKNKNFILKEIYIRPNISMSDLNIKIKKMILFLKHNFKVKVFIKFIGREMNYPDLGFELLKKISVILCDEEKLSTIFSTSNKIENKQIYTLFIPRK